MKKSSSFKIVIFALAVITGIYALAFFYGEKLLHRSIIQKNILDSQALDSVCFFYMESGCFDVQIADTDKKRRKGLMFVEQLPEKEGMLFVYDEEKKYSFWMKNTLIPLDIIWIDKDHRVVDVQTVQPCKTEHCPSFTPKEQAQYILEINAGIAERAGIKVGTHASIRTYAESYCPNDLHDCKIEGQYGPKGEKTGIWKAYYQSGTLYTKIEYENGKEKKRERWYPNGKIFDISSVSGSRIFSGPSDREYTTYYDNGQQESELSYKNGKASRIRKKRHNNGELRTIEYHYQNGNLQKTLSYYDNGKQSGITNFDRDFPGKNHGIFKTRHKNGNLWYETTYNHGKKHGLAKIYTENGTPIYEKQRDNGEPTGIRKKRDEEGNLIFEGPYTAWR